MFFRRKDKKKSDEPKGAGRENRAWYRRTPNKSHGLGVMLQLADGDPIAGELIDVSAGGAGVRFSENRDPDLSDGDAGELVFSSLVHKGEVRVEVKVVNIQTFPGEGQRYGFEFQRIDKLFEQLDSFYFNFFNRRRAVRVRPELDRKIPIVLGLASGELEFTVNDLSPVGVGFVVREGDAERIRKDGQFDLKFKIPKTTTVVECQATLRHATPLSKGTLLGIEILQESYEYTLQRPDLESYVKKREEEMARWDAARS